MKNSQPTKVNPDSKPAPYAGLDVGTEELVLLICKEGKPFDRKVCQHRLQVVPDE